MLLGPRAAAEMCGGGRIDPCLMSALDGSPVGLVQLLLHGRPAYVAVVFIRRCQVA
jgi:hypothetical protein